ncbi:hypothetical protein C0989_005761, partial [Termitomyces sp. Mn162]
MTKLSKSFKRKLWRIERVERKCLVRKLNCEILPQPEIQKFLVPKEGEKMPKDAKTVLQRP